MVVKVEKAAASPTTPWRHSEPPDMVIGKTRKVILSLSDLRFVPLTVEICESLHKLLSDGEFRLGKLW